MSFLAQMHSFRVYTTAFAEYWRHCALDKVAKRLPLPQLSSLQAVRILKRLFNCFSRIMYVLFDCYTLIVRKR